ncbi:MAG: abortive phage infection protein [Clostridia bacterium]|nr:abortive phage infection protein [Clostridia bacterium]
MTPYEQLDELFRQNNGIVQTAQALELGISKPTFYAYTKHIHAELVSHGVYMAEGAWKDGMYMLHLRCPQAVFSHESALLLHGLTDREPSAYSVTLKTGYNPSGLKPDGVKVYTIRDALHGVGIVTADTPFGHKVPVYDMERTVCDIVRSRRGIELQTMQNALMQYAHRKDKDLGRLMYYAERFHVDKLLRQYLMVLL